MSAHDKRYLVMSGYTVIGATNDIQEAKRIATTYLEKFNGSTLQLVERFAVGAWSPEKAAVVLTLTEKG